MNKILVAVVGTALVLAFAAPAMQAETSNRDANIAWLLEQRPDMPMDAPVTIYVGGVAHEVSALEAVEIFGDRSERVNIAQLALGASSEEATLVGDIWIFEDTYQPFHGCPAVNVIAPTPTPFVPVNDQLWIYGGAGFVIGEATSDVAAAGYLDFGLYIAWTTKTIGDHTGQESYLLGNSDFFCFDWGNWGVTYYPWADGYAVIG